MSAPAIPSTLRTLVVLLLATVISVQPVFLAGALAVELTTELGFGAAGLGVVIAASRLSAAISARTLGRWTDQFGSILALRAGVGIAACSALAIGLFAHSFAALLVFMVIAGLGQSITQPAANRMLLNRVPSTMQGVAFGFKQSAPPAASMLAGLSIPLIALTVGWRWAFFAVPMVAVFVLVGIGRRPASAASARGKAATAATLPPRATLLTLVIAFACANAAGTSVPAFYVSSAFDAGTSVSFAGTLLAVASIASILTRLASGVVADRISHGHFRIISGLLACGAGGLALLATGRASLMAVGVVIAMAGSWGFHTLLWFSLMRAFPKSPGAVTGAVFPGGLVGGVVGPVGFGFVSEQFSYSVAWAVVAVFALVAAGLMFLAARRITGVDPAASGESAA